MTDKAKQLTDDEKREMIEKMRDKSKQLKSNTDQSEEGYYKKDDLKSDIDDFKYASSGGDKAKAGVKVVGKSLFNIGKFAKDKVLPGLLESAANVAERNMKK